MQRHPWMCPLSPTDNGEEKNGKWMRVCVRACVYFQRTVNEEATKDETKEKERERERDREEGAKGKILCFLSAAYSIPNTITSTWKFHCYVDGVSFVSRVYLFYPFRRKMFLRVWRWISIHFWTNSLGYFIRIASKNVERDKDGIEFLFTWEIKNKRRNCCVQLNEKARRIWKSSSAITTQVNVNELK